MKNARTAAYTALLQVDVNAGYSNIVIDKACLLYTSSDFCVNSGNQRANSIDKSIPQAYGGLTKNNI